MNCSPNPSVAVLFTFLVALPGYAQHGPGGGPSSGHFGNGNFSGHSVSQSVGHSISHMFGHHSGGLHSRLGKASGSRGEFPPLAGAAFIHGRVVVLPGPSHEVTQDWQPIHPTSARFIPASAPRIPFRENRPFDTGFCDSFGLTRRRILFSGDFDCFEASFLLDGFFFDGFWSDSFFAGADVSFSPALPSSPAIPDSSGLAARNDPSVPHADTESSAPFPVKAQQPVTLLQLRDGSMYGLTRYWVEGDRLHYVTDYGGENRIAFEQVDLEKTAALNAARGTPLLLPANMPNP